MQVGRLGLLGSDLSVAYFAEARGPAKSKLLLRRPLANPGSASRAEPL